MDSKKGMSDNRKRQAEYAARRKKKRKNDILCIVIGIVFIIFASIMISALKDDTGSQKTESTDTSAVSQVETEESLNLTFDEKLGRIAIKSFTCLLGETDIDIDDFVVNAGRYGCTAQFTMAPDSTTAGDHAVEVRITSDTGENRLFRTTLKVLNVLKSKTTTVGSEPLVYSDFVLDNSLTVIMDKEPSEFDYSVPGKHTITLTIGSISYECTLNIIEGVPTVSTDESKN